MEKLTFENVKAELVRHEHKKADYYVDFRDIEIEDHGKVLISGRRRYPDGTPGLFEKVELDITDHAMSQFYGILGIPSSYAKKTPFELMRPHVDYHMQEKLEENKSYLFRTFRDSGKNHARAILSGRYGILDNLTVLKALEESLETDFLDIKGFSTDYYGDMLNLRMIDTRYQEIGVDPNGRPNPYYAGVHIVNGETGRYPVSIAALIWEQWCDNGAVRERYGNPLMKRKHIGDADALSIAFERASIAAPEVYEASMDSFKRAQEVTIAHPYLALNNLMKKERAIFSTDDFKLSVIDSFESRPEKTRYGVASSITEAAQKLPYSKRLAAERLAGDILFFDYGISEGGDEDEAKGAFQKIRARVEAEDAEIILA